jgi:hypothetical protein
LNVDFRFQLSNRFTERKIHRLKNRFNSVVSNGDFLQVFDFNGAPEEIRTPDPLAQLAQLEVCFCDFARRAASQIKQLDSA